MDLLKALAMILVCSYHFSIVAAEYSENMILFTQIRRLLFGINSICMPLFFMVNGALLMNKELIIKKHMQYCGMMLAQYYIWRLITINAVAFFVQVPMIEIDKIEILNAVFFPRI